MALRKAAPYNNSSHTIYTPSASVCGWKIANNVVFEPTSSPRAAAVADARTEGVFLHIVDAHAVAEVELVVELEVCTGAGGEIVLALWERAGAGGEVAVLGLGVAF